MKLKLCIVLFLLWLPNRSSAQYDLDLIKVRKSKNRLIFKVQNKSKSIVVFENWDYYFTKRNEILPRKYYVKNDTLVIDMMASSKLIETGHKMKDSIVIDDDDVESTVFVLKQNDVLKITINSDDKHSDYHYVSIKLSPRDRLVIGVD